MKSYNTRYTCTDQFHFFAEGLNQKGGKAAFEVQLHVLRFFHFNFLFDFLFHGILLGIILGN